ncbi:benABC operon transcriptional activator BenR [Pseudomonas sp. FeS53a]|uniref:AraC family transcriptional regulator n=1 Tax=Pseudomonas sp. FeS53a TaxID=1604022 RepID=UPI0005C94A07|nr:AraC family transcriptional regulator [Pseudomonas sp. FeS53a]KIV72916.1 benABC operon transcriptional activator BenR [Pseudomonas sp. FeS53a]
MNLNESPRCRGLLADCFDLAGARAWMAAICGPHRLDAARPERIRFHHSGNVLPTSAITLGHVEYGTDVTIGVGEEATLDCYSLSLPLGGEQELDLAGRRLRSDTGLGLVLSPDQSQRLTIAGNCRKLQVAIPRRALVEVLEALLERSVVQPLHFEPQMDAVDGATGAWWRMARHLTDELARGAALYGQGLFSRDLESAFIKGLLLAQPNSYSDELQARQAPQLPHYLVRARDFMRTHARENLCLEDIERAAGVSRFKLFEGFRRYFGVSPMAFLKRHRLLAVRQALLDDHSPRNISAIAMAWGFTHLGRFSCEYRKLFGEPPSATLQRLAAQRDASC